jgi:hypothetical protein
MDSSAAASKETPLSTPSAASVTPTDDHDIPDSVLSENRIGMQLIHITESLTAEKLPYIVGGPLLQDCSGIFLRITDSLRTRIPVLENKSKYIFPNARQKYQIHRIAHGRQLRLRRDFCQTTRDFFLWQLQPTMGSRSEYRNAGVVKLVYMT